MKQDTDQTARKTTSTAYPYHALADLFPLMEGDAFAELVTSIKQNGLRDPIILYQDQILDGRNRYRACEKAGANPHYQSFVRGDPLIGDPLQFVIDRNLRRRHLDSSQRAMIAAKIETLKHGGDRKSDQDANLHVDRASAAKLLNVSERSVASAAKVLDNAAPETVAAVERGEIAVSAAAMAVASTTSSGRVAKPQGTGNMEWYTPKEHIEAARAVLVAIDLDPASCDFANLVVKATRYYTKETDGLAQEWHGTILLNPPFADGLIGPFVSKLIAEISAGRVSAAIMLTNNSTDTAWFREAAKAASAICFTDGRIPFYGPDGKEASPAQGQCFFYFGENVKLFTEVFQKIGMVFTGGPAMDAA